MVSIGVRVMFRVRASISVRLRVRVRINNIRQRLITGRICRKQMD